MMRIICRPFLVLMFFAAAGAAQASVSFQPRELFRIPFGATKDALGAKIDNGLFLVPRDFTMDDAGRFYIYDVNNHRVARYSPDGKFQLAYRYLDTADQVFAHADSQENLWIMVSDKVRGIFYGVYDPHGRGIHTGTFQQFNHFRIHPDDNFTLHFLLSSDRSGSVTESWIFDENTLRMTKENMAPPPAEHHAVHQADQTFFTDSVPGGNSKTSKPVTRITDQAHHGVADIAGTVIYVTGQGEIYTRVGPREIDVYDAQGKQLSRLKLSGLSAACASIRFDASGNIYELDGIPDDATTSTPVAAKGIDAEDLRYGPSMPGMRVIKWERQ